MSQAEASGRFYTLPSELNGFGKALGSQFSSTLNSRRYCVESPDGILPSSKKGVTVMKYADNNMSAAVATDFGNYRSVVVGFPFECIDDDAVRDKIMFDVLNYLCNR